MGIWQGSYSLDFIIFKIYYVSNKFEYSITQSLESFPGTNIVAYWAQI